MWCFLFYRPVLKQDCFILLESLILQCLALFLFNCSVPQRSLVLDGDGRDSVFHRSQHHHPGQRTHRADRVRIVLITQTPCQRWFILLLFVDLGWIYALGDPWSWTLMVSGVSFPTPSLRTLSSSLPTRRNLKWPSVIQEPCLISWSR